MLPDGVRGGGSHAGAHVHGIPQTVIDNFSGRDVYKRQEEKLLPVESVFEQLDAYQVQGDGQKLLENGNWLYADLVIPYTKEKTAAACERGTFVPEQQLRICLLYTSCPVHPL